ncbi:MAG: MaoC family dehydratase N-terminal domain-containing protein [Pseudomonadales bacterium]|nr:MaoC family dehydratase N-terminal domain-containing protein [Pseudomonadales bacterium]
MPEPKVLTDELMAWVGRESAPKTAQVTERDLRRFATAHTLWEPNPLHFDKDAAAKTPFGGTIAPFLSYGNSFSEFPHVSVLGGDGHSRKVAPKQPTLTPPLPLPRAMAGGTEVEYIRPIRAGDTITQQSKLVELTEKLGKSGPLVFVTTATTYSNQNGNPAVIVKMTLIYR